MTEKKNNGTAPAEAPRKKKDGVFGQYFRKNRSTKTAAEIAAEIERVMREEAPAAEQKPAAKKTPKAPQQPRPKAENKPRQGEGKPKKAPAPAKGQGKGKAAEGQNAPAKKAQKPAQPAKAKADGKSKKAAEPAKKQPAKSSAKKPAAPAAVPQANRTTRRKKPDGTRRPPLKIISLGGLGEIGKNLTVFETQQDIIIVDCGSAFPDDDLPGVDLVIPDFTYLEKNAGKIRGISSPTGTRITSAPCPSCSSRSRPRCTAPPSPSGWSAASSKSTAS